MEQLVLVFGEPIKKLPRDLYIPPDALRVLLMTFEGPLDLLLYLIKKDNLEIKGIPVAEITAQYLQYIEVMQNLDMTLAAEYLLMAATLIEIKSKFLFPNSKLKNNAEEIEDPRFTLAQQLLAYERTQKGAHHLLLKHEKNINLSAYLLELPPVPPSPNLERLRLAMQALLTRISFSESHQINSEKDNFSRHLQKMTVFVEKLKSNDWQNLKALCEQENNREELVYNIMALLELDKSQKIIWKQEEMFADIFISKRD